MEEIFTYDDDCSYTTISEQTPYCVVSYGNIVKLFDGNSSTDQMMKLYYQMLKYGSADLIKGQSPEVLNQLTDKDGLKLIDYAIILGNFEFVKHLVENCEADINDIPLKLKQNTLHYLLTRTKPEEDTKLVEHAKIILYLLKNGGVAYTLDDYTYDTNDLDMEMATPLEMFESHAGTKTVLSLELYMNNCVKALGKNVDLDDNLTQALDVVLRSGVVPSYQTMTHPNYLKYKLDYLFDYDSRDIKLSTGLAYAARNLTERQEDYYDMILNDLVRNTNREIGTSDDSYDTTCDELDKADAEAAKYENSMEEEYKSGEEFDVSKLERMSEEEIEALDDIDYNDLFKTEDEDADEEDEDDEDYFVPKYNVFELLEINKRNSAYADDERVKNLWEDNLLFNQFQSRCKTIKQYKQMGDLIAKRVDYIQEMLACRHSDEADMFIK